MRIVTDSVRVRVPATSANLGPGFDAFGLALELHDVVRVRATASATRTHVTGQGAETVPDGEDHLVVRAVRAGLEHVGAPQVGLELSAHNQIPHGRGLGSSAAAVVAGLMAARGMISEPEALDDAVMLDLATQWEGHPDNAAATILGGATLTWLPQENAVEAPETGEWTTPAPRVGVTALGVAEGLTVTVFIPAHPVATRVARSVLPETVPHRDAAFNAARAAMLVLALGGRTDLALEATADRLHQPYRGDVLPESMDLVGWLRGQGLPAVISGAGPTVLVLGAVPPTVRRAATRGGWDARALDVDRVGATLGQA